MPIDNPLDLVAARLEMAKLTNTRSKIINTTVDSRRIRDIINFDRDIIDRIEDFKPRIDPCDASPSVPLVMLPVRVETKLRTDAGQPILRVRIYPDTVHVDNLSRSIDEKEAEAGRAYWSALWADPEDPEAWSTLQHLVGRRAGWIAHTTRPLNSAQRSSGVEPNFPPRSDEISLGTVARCLPNHFIVHTHIHGQAPIITRGTSVPPDLPISPIALGDALITKAGKLNVPAGSEWTVDFAAACRVGMGVEVPLPFGTPMIDRLVVVGVRQLVAEEENARDFSELLTSHRYSGGLSFPPTGTPTNNDSSDQQAERSLFRPDLPPEAPPLDPGRTDADATSMAALLGVTSSLIQNLMGSDTAQSTLDQAQKAANTALWYATWAPALEWISKSNAPGFSRKHIENGRQLHRDHVRAAGHTSTLRINAQPYGILPVSVPSRWKPAKGELSAAIAPVITRTLQRWVTAADQVPHVRPNGDLTDKDLRDMMGTAPISQAVRVRAATEGRIAPWLSDLIGLGPAVWANESLLRRAMLSQFSVEAATRCIPPALSDASRSIPLPLVSERDAEVISSIISGGNPKVDSVLQALLTLAWEQADKISQKTIPPFQLPKIFNLLGSELNDAAEIQKFAQEAVQPISAATDPNRVYAHAQIIRDSVNIAGRPVESVQLSQFEPIAEAQTSLAQVALDLGDTQEARWIAREALASLLEAYSIRGEVRSAMNQLGGIPIGERRIAVASALDIASHRVDAWATGLAHSRIKPPATAGAAMTLGAFGYAENIDLGPQQATTGWVHAPSYNHAIAAGILNSAHQSNIGAKAGTTPFAIDLTSRRGAEVRRILEGIHAGQTLGELLGHQIERGLTGSAARFQLSLRELAPMTPSELTHDLEPVDRTNAMNAPGVVDGLTLLKKFPADNRDPLRAAINKKPGNIYITSNWAESTPEEWTAVKAALAKAEDSLDAVSDALLSESVLQYVDGNPARAAAAMDSAGPGGTVDPNLGVFDVRQTGRQLTHALFATIPATASGWSQDRPRAVAEPRGEAWAAGRLADPTLIIVTDVAGTKINLWQAGWAALDLVFADSLVDLENDLRDALPAMGDHPLADIRGEDWPEGAISIMEAFTLAGSLRGLLVGSRALMPDDLVRPGQSADSKRAVDTGDLILRCEQLLNGLAAVLNSGEAAFAALDPTTLTVAEADLPGIRAAVRDLAAYGASLRPDAEVPTNVAWAWTARTGMEARYLEAYEVYNVVLRPTGGDRTLTEIVDAANKIAETILGDDFRLLPLLIPRSSADEFATSVIRPMFIQPAKSKVSAFLRDHATVHKGAARLAETHLIGRALSRNPDMTVIQLTAREGTLPAQGTDRWLAGHLAEDVPWPTGTATHAVVEMLGSPMDSDKAIAGISFDAWTEMIPFQPDHQAFEQDADPDNPLRLARATSGLAVHAHLPSGRAPQVLLSLVSPDGERWTTETVVESVLAAMDLGRARMVTLEKTPGDAAILPAIYAASPWLQPSKFLYLADLFKNLPDVSAYLFLTEEK